MKRVLSLVLVLVMVLGSIMPAFAEATDSQEALDLQAYGLIAGKGGDLGLDEASPLTRAEMAVILAKLYGEADIAVAYDMPATFTDIEGHWAAKWIAYAETKGWMVGADAKFRPDDILSAQEINTLMLKVVGKFTAWETANADAEAAGVAVVAADATLVLRGEIFKTLRATLDITKEGSDKTIGEELALTGYVAPEAPVVEPEALEVVSVKALNLVELQIVFNQEITDEDLLEAVEDLTNYTIDGITMDGAGSTASVALQADNMTAVLTLDGANDVEFAQQGEYTLDISSDVVETSVDFTAFDATVPTAVSIELTGPNTFEVTFSEPVDEDNVGTVEVNDGVYGISTIDQDNTNVVVVTLAASSLTAGDYDVTVADFYDFAGYKALDKAFVLTYVVDATLPTATLDSAEQTEVVIVFDKAVTDADGTALDEDYFYHTFSSYTPDSVSTTDNRTFTLTFTTNPLPEGSVKIYVNHDANDSIIEDAWGNSMSADVMFTATVTADSTRPEVSSVSVEDEDNVYIYFSESVNATEAADEDNYTVLKDGEAIDETFVATYNSTDKYVDLDFSADLTGTYTVEVSGISDISLNENEITAVTLSFTVNDETGLTTADLSAISVAGTPDAVIINFGEAMASSVVEASNYMISTDAGTTWTALDSDDTVAFFGGNEKVKITFDADTDVDHADFRVQVARVNDLAGNTASFLAASVNPTPDTAPTVASVKVTSYKTIEVAFTGVVTSITAADFAVNKDAAGAHVPAAVSIVTADDVTTVTLTLKATEQLASDATDADDTRFDVTVTGTAMLSETGLALADSVEDADDAIAPAMADVDQTAANVITVTFSEDVTVTATYVAQDFVLVDADGTTLVAGVDYTAAANGTDAVNITLINDYADYEDDMTVASVASPKYVVDADGSALALVAFDAEELTTDATAVTATIPAAMNATTNDADSLVITLSEAIYDATSHAAIADGASVVAYLDETAMVGGAVTTAVYDLDTLTITIVFDGSVANGDAFDLVLTDLEDAAGIDGAADVTYTIADAGADWN